MMDGMGGNMGDRNRSNYLKYNVGNGHRPFRGTARRYINRHGEMVSPLRIRRNTIKKRKVLLRTGQCPVPTLVSAHDIQYKALQPAAAEFWKIGFAKYDFLRPTGIWVTQTCRWYALFGQYVEILMENPLWILDFCANSCIMECRLKMGGVYIGRTDRRAVR